MREMRLGLVAGTFALALMAVMMLTPGAARAADFKMIDTSAMKAMLDDKTPMTLIDARTKVEYDEAHIPGAINIEEKNFDASMGMLPADKGSLLVMYCNGMKCGKSKKVAAKAAAAGFTNITIYADGFPVWEEHTLPIVAGPDYGKKIETTKLKPAEVKALIDAAKDDYVLVDVRDEKEYAEGHIPTAINIPVDGFATGSSVLPKEKKIIVYCNSGGRSYNAYRKLMKLAYPNIFQTTLSDWTEAGLPLEKPKQ